MLYASSAGPYRSDMPMQPNPISETEGPFCPSVLMTVLPLQQLERVCPTVASKSGDAPQHAQRLDRAGALDRPHVRHVEPELVEDCGYRALRLFLIAADE